MGIVFRATLSVVFAVCGKRMQSNAERETLEHKLHTASYI